MEEIVKALCELLETGKLSGKNENVKMTVHENGDITIKYNAPKKNEKLEAIVAEINAMDDDMFNAAAKLLRKTDEAAFKAMTTLEDKRPDAEAVIKAYSVFKRCVVEIAETRIKALTAEVNRLYSTYLEKPAR